MEMQLESKDFIVKDNIFSAEVLKILEPYANLLPTDKSSYDTWSSSITINRTAPECFTCDIVGKDRLEIINDLYNNIFLPCYKKKWLRDCDIAIQKIPVGGFIPRHKDICIFSLTVFLSEVEGGEFSWWDDINNKNIVESKYNRGIFCFNSDYVKGFDHQVEPVKMSTRFTLQLFVFDKNKTSINKQIEDNNDE